MRRTSRTKRPASGTSARSSSAEQAGAQAVVEIVVVVGDVVGDRGRPAPRPARTSAKIKRSCRGRPAAMACAARAPRRGHAPVSGPLCLTRPSSVSQVRLRPSKPRTALEPRHHLEALRVVVEAAVGRHAPPRARARRHGRRADGRGRGPAPAPRPGPRRAAAARAMARAICATSRRVGQPRAVVVALVEHEHLRLVGQAAESGGMHDAVAVALERRAHRAGGLGMERGRRSSRPGLRRQPRGRAKPAAGPALPWIARLRWLPSASPGLTRLSATLCIYAGIAGHPTPTKGTARANRDDEP